MNQKFNFHELKTANRLPSPSGTALEIMKLLQRDDVEINQVSQLIKIDPALSGRILQFVNSAAMGKNRSISNINEAIIMMGISAVKNFALSLSLVGNDSYNCCPNFDYSTYWSKSLAVAVAITGLSLRERVVNAEEAFTLGLLHEIGQLALATAWSESYSECIAIAHDDELLKLEQECFAITHNVLTTMLLKDWGFPDLFIEALKLSFEARHINSSNSTKTNRLAQQLVFANKIANYCIADEAYREVLFPDLLLEANHHSFGENELNTFIEDILKRWQDWGKIINVKTDIRQSSPELTADKNILSGLNILMVDDDVATLVRLSKQLIAAGHKVAACKDAESALKYALERKPDLIITDWHMKPMNGIELSRTLHSSTWGRSIYIILLTSTEDESTLVEAFSAGIDDYVTTPVSLKVLLARIRAGQRIVALQREVERERKDLQRYIANLAVANRRLELMANTDVLTGLSNRRHSLNRLEQEWESSQHHHRPLSVLMLDLDYFKSVNDSLGHDAGDLVLIHTAKIMRHCARATDIPCRLGGEEFFVIAPNTDAKEAVLLAEQIRQTIERDQVKNVPLLKPMTVSIGVACSIDGKPTWKELMTLADQALYAVKREKRNAVRLSE